MGIKDIAWNSAHEVKDKNPNEWRMDACGALINYNCYNKPGRMFCWEIDHIFPASLLQKAGVPQDLIDNPINIRALNRKNNESKSDNYPRYKRSYILQGADNVEIDESTTFASRFINVGPFKREEICELYKDYITEFKSGKLNL